MKRTLIYVLIVILVAGVLGTLVARDPGYVLISYGGATLQTGLWVMFFLLAVLIAAVYYLLRLFKIVGNSAATWRSWRIGRVANRASRLAAKGMIYYQAGEFERAERFLRSGAEAGNNPSVNFVYAARAADAQNKAEQREAYLRQARESDAEAAQAVAVASAEMAIDRREFGQALRALEGVQSNLRIARLKCKALLELRSWQALGDLIPALRQAGEAPNKLFSIQKQVALAQLAEADVTDDARGTIYKKLPDGIKRDAEVVLAWCSHLQGETAAESAIRAALNTVWHPALVELYGGLGRDTLGRRVKTAEGWQKSHPDDASLQLCLGELYEANGDKDKARAAYERSVDLKGSAAANKHLGRLFAFEGDYKKSNEYLTQALRALE